MPEPTIGAARSRILWLMLVLYILGRISQLYAGRVPTILIVVLHVVPPAIFAAAHGSAIYGARGMTAFAVFCLGFGTLAESLSLRTTFPFGRYHFTDVMGPKVFELPILLALAYLGIGYVAWTLSVLIHKCHGRPLRGQRVFTVPLLAAFVMTAWDLAMDPVWTSLDRAWVWEEGGAFFGVPLTNFFGWFVTAWLYYQAFALYERTRPARPALASQSFWISAILLYAVCALGNLLILKQPLTPLVFTDPAGNQWATLPMLAACAAVSLLVMCPLAVTAWLQTRASRRAMVAPAPTPI